MTVPDDRGTLAADCSRCFGLCCVALPFTASADFAVTKPAGTPCLNLTRDFRCGVHTRLRAEGFRGCTVFDCFGAGQQVAQVTFAGRDWREHPDTMLRMFDVFAVMRPLHELLWYLTEAVSLPQARPIHPDLRRAMGEVRQLTGLDSDTLVKLDVNALRARVDPLLIRTSELVRGKVTARGKNRRGADLVGARLRGTDLHRANLRGALLIAAALLAPYDEGAPKGKYEAPLPMLTMRLGIMNGESRLGPFVIKIVC